MGTLYTTTSSSPLHVPNLLYYSSNSQPSPLSSFFHHKTSSDSTCIFSLRCNARRNSGVCFRRPGRGEEEEKEEEGGVKLKGVGKVIPIIKQEIEKDEGSLGIVAACLVGLLTGFAVVLFNNGVHEIRDFFWDGIPSRGASWLREEPLQDTWKRIIFVPTCGGIIVSLLNVLRAALDTPSHPETPLSNLKGALRPVLKAVAASVTLGTGNSLGPEGPSVEIGASIAKGVTRLFDRSNQTRLSLSLRAAGSAAGISSGFNAAVAGCFFAVESVLWPSPENSSPSLTNITSMVILSAVIASVVSEVGLGSEPAFKVPEYDFRSPSELPLYLLLGILCGLVSLTLSRSTKYALIIVENAHREIGVPKFVFPIMGGFTVGLIALAYPEVLYWGFQNVDILLESRPLVKGLPADLLLQLIGIKILATSLCRATGLVGGYYAPSLFIGAATGMAYGKLASYAVSLSDPIFHLSFLEVASPQAYGLVGMAATLAGVCQVPLTAVLLLFELTQDYRIVLPLLGAVGLSSLIASSQPRKADVGDKNTSSGSKDSDSQEPKRSFLNPSVLSSHSSSIDAEASNLTDLCELESSLCLDDPFTELRELEEIVSVSQAMLTRYVTVLISTSLMEAVSLMLKEKQSCALIVDNDNFLIGMVTLGDIQDFCEARVQRGLAEVKKLLVSQIYHVHGEKHRIVWTATPEMNLVSARTIMNRQGLDQLPVVSEQTVDHGGYVVGLLDRGCMDLTCRAIATQEFFRVYLSKKPNG